MQRKIRMTQPTMLVLDLFLIHQNKSLSGAEIAKDTRLLSGTLYPILHRLERCGWLSSKLENVDPSEVGRPRRRYYSLKGQAQNIAYNELSKRGFYGERKSIKGEGYVPTF